MWRPGLSEIPNIQIYTKRKKVFSFNAREEEQSSKANTSFQGRMSDNLTDPFYISCEGVTRDFSQSGTLCQIFIWSGQRGWVVTGFHDRGAIQSKATNCSLITILIRSGRI